MNANIAIGKSVSKVERIKQFVLGLVVWFLHRYNKTNKYVNVWERSQKDITAFGVDSDLRFYISRDNRLHVRWQTWSIYIGKPWFINR